MPLAIGRWHLSRDWVARCGFVLGVVFWLITGGIILHFVTNGALFQPTMVITKEVWVPNNYTWVEEIPDVQRAIQVKKSTFMNLRLSVVHLTTGASSTGLAPVMTLKYFGRRSIGALDAYTFEEPIGGNFAYDFDHAYFTQNVAYLFFSRDWGHIGGLYFAGLLVWGIIVSVVGQLVAHFLPI